MSPRPPTGDAPSPTTAGVHVVVLNWNGGDDTLACVRSLQALDGAAPVSVIVVDNGSTDGSVARLRQEPGITLLENRENLGFAGGCNVGTRHALEAGAGWVWLLNNDTTVDPGSLRAQLTVAASDERIGIVGAVLRHAEPPHDVQAWGGGRRNRWFGTFTLNTTPGPLDHVVGASMFLRRSMIEEIGLLDERYFFFLEDSDYSVRATDAGWRLAVADGCVVHHKVGASVNRGSLGRSHDADRLLATGTGIFLGTHAGLRIVVAAPSRLAGMVLNRVRRRQLRRVPLVVVSFVRGLWTGFAARPRRA